jgi:hypothetical protein
MCADRPKTTMSLLYRNLPGRSAAKVILPVTFEQPVNQELVIFVVSGDVIRHLSVCPAAT